MREGRIAYLKIIFKIFFLNFEKCTFLFKYKETRAAQKLSEDA